MTITRVELIPSRPRPKNRSRWPVKFKKRSEKGPDEQPGGEISLHADEQDLFDRHDLPWDGDGPYPAFKTIQEFYRDYQELVKHDKLDLNKCRYSEIWLDDREYGTERAREYDVDLDAERLKRLLLTPRYGADEHPNADRRLLYISNPSGDHIGTLASMRLYPHQLQVLADALERYINSEIVLQVRTSLIGFTFFRLEVHMPCVTLLETDTSQLSNLKSRSRGEASKWINLEFLNMSPESGRGGRAYWIHKAQVSFVIHGSDDTRWTAYAFVDTESKSLCGKRIEEQEMGDTDTDDGQEADDDDDDGVNEDPIAHDRSSSDVVDADKPTWDPRMYFIMVFDHRSNRMAQEWKKIVKALDRAIKRRDAPKDPQKAHEYMVELLDIVEKLYDWSTETVGTWKRFSRKDGDINFFRDITDERARGRLDRIRDSFVTIEKCGLDLKRIRKNCGRVEDNFSRQMKVDFLKLFDEMRCLTRYNQSLSRETTRISRASHETVQVASSMNQIWIPLGITVAYFGTQDQIFQFRRDQTSFIILFLVMVLIVNLWICLQRIACCLFERTRMAKQLHLWLVSHELAGIILFGSSPKAPGRPEVITLDEVDLQQSSKDRQVV